MQEKIPDKDLFMICAALNPGALAEMPAPYRLRGLRRNEYAVWKALQMDGAADEAAWHAALDAYFARVYAPRGEAAFFDACQVVVGPEDVPVASCFIWKAYDRFSTIHWLKVRRACEGQGIGRALLSALLRPLAAQEYPVYLHTHPSSYRAIGLYADFGFRFVTDARVGARPNDLAECMPILRRVMPPPIYARLGAAQAGQDFLDAANASGINEF